MGTKKVMVIILIIVLVAGGSVWLYQKYYHPCTGNPDDYLTMKQAAKMGDTTTYKLMIQIASRNKDAKEGFQRGDIVLIMPSSHKFSVAEKTGFLIIKMDLTKKQTELLTQSLDKIKKEKDKETGLPQRETLKQRKYSVDLAKIGIAPNVRRGREIEDKTFQWEDVIAKKSQ